MALDSIFKNIEEITLQDLYTEVKTQLKGPKLVEIRNSIRNTIKLGAQYEAYSQKTGGAGNSKKIATIKKSFEDSFLKTQNLLNNYAKQQLLITLVSRNDSGKRTIYIGNNTLEHLAPNKWGRMSYMVNNHMAILRNSLMSEKDENILQNVTETVEKRYKGRDFKRKGVSLINTKGQESSIKGRRGKAIYWFYPGMEDLKGYFLNNRGPINEAFVAHYVNNIPLLNSNLEGQIHEFMTNNKYGVISADGKRGYLVGDQSLDNILQFAIKGIGGGLQGIKNVLEELKLIEQENFSKDAIDNFVQKFGKEEIEKEVAAQARIITEEGLALIAKEAGGIPALRDYLNSL